MGAPAQNKEITIKDTIRGDVSWNTDTLGDFVLLRSNGLPVYNFCVAIDDCLMKISHVIRCAMAVVVVVVVVRAQILPGCPRLPLREIVHHQTRGGVVAGVRFLPGCLRLPGEGTTHHEVRWGVRVVCDIVSVCDLRMAVCLASLWACIGGFKTRVHKCATPTANPSSTVCMHMQL